MTRLVLVMVIAVSGRALADKPADPATCPDQNACDNVASDLKATDPKGAAIANERACTFGEQYSCEEAARAYFDGTAGTKDPGKAFKLRERGCALGERETCVAMATMYLRGLGVAKDGKRAVAAFEKGCKAGALQ